MHVVGTIVDETCKLVGLILKGKEAEFGGASKEEVEKKVPLNALPNGLKTREIEVNNHQIHLVNGFKFCHLDRTELLKGNQCIPLESNDITLTEIISDGTNTLGYTVSMFGGKLNKRLRYSDVVDKAQYLKPANFIIREINGKRVVVGKYGVLSEQLNTINIGGKKQENTVEHRSTAEKPRNVKNIKPIEEYSRRDGATVDIIDIFGYLKAVDGLIVKLPDEAYTSAVSGIDKGEFKQRYNIEIANPEIKYGEKKVNATLTFRKLGYAESKETGKEYDTFLHAAKSIFKNGENKMNKIGALIHIKEEQWFTSRGIAYTEVNNKEYLEEIGRFSNISGMKLIELDLSSVGLISDEKLKSSILDDKELEQHCLEYYTDKLILKYIGSNGELIKGIKKRIGNQKYAELYSGGIYYKYRSLSKEQLLDIKAANINIITGEYQKFGYNGKAEKDESEIYIDYQVANLDYSKVTGKQIVEMAMNGDSAIIPPVMVSVIQMIENLETDEDKLNKIKSIKLTAEKNLDLVNSDMWMHRAAMLIAGRGKYIHTHDKDKWRRDTRSKAKNYDVYIKDSDTPITLKVKGVAIDC